MAKAKKIIIPFDMYLARVEVSVTKDRHRLPRSWPGHVRETIKGAEAEGSCCFPWPDDFTGDQVRCVAFIHLTNWNADTIAHEAVHAAFYILDSRGIPLSQANDEPLAYMVGYIVSKITAARRR